MITEPQTEPADDWLDGLPTAFHSEEWAEAEQSYCDFMGAHSEHAVLRLMTDDQFLAWETEYRRLYVAVWRAQMAYYRAIRGAS